MAGESITFDFLSRGSEKLQGDFRKVADNTVLAAKGAKVLADVIEKLGNKEDRTAAESKILASALRQTGDAADRVAARAVLADAAIRRLDDAMQDSSKNAEKAAGGVGALAGTGGIPGGGMGAVIAAGAVLSPVLVTLGVGLAGFGLAAAAAAKPIADAAQKTGGLRANLKSLNPEQQAVARGILGLGREFDQFQKALQPEVLTVFNAGIKIAGGLLHDVQPVAEATGKALGVMLGRIDTEFKSGTWQQFFKFMADTAGTDMKLLTDNFIGLLNILPTLLTDLQPLATEFLTASDNALKLAGSIANFGKSTDKTSNSVGTNTGLLGFLAKAVANVTSFMKPGGVAAGALKAGLDGIPGSAGKAGTAMGAVTAHAQTLAGQLKADKAAVDALTSSENKALSPLLAYSNALIAQHNDANSLATALKASHDRIGLQTAVQRASFSAAQTYIQDLLTTASAAVKSHQGIDAQISSIRGALPLLQNVKGGTRQYWQEVSTLVGWLHKLQAIKLIQEAIHVNASGVWSVTPGKIGLPGGTAGGPFAAGGLIRMGTGPTSDDVHALVSRGEYVQQAKAVNKYGVGAMDAVNQGRAVIGYAGGGVVGSYGPGAVSGLPRWIAGETNATVSAVARSTAAALVAGLKAAQASAASGAPGAQGGPTSASAAQAQAYAASRLGAYGWGASQMPPLIALWNQESGWNRFARNPSSGAYGIPQALPPGKMGAAANPPTSSAAAQINWGLGYIRGRYGSPAGAEAHERAFNWYAKGGLVPGFASGGTVGQQGAAWLRAWRARSGGGFGAAWGPVSVNEQIAQMAAAAGRASTLARAGGLSAGQHRYWAATAADEKKRLGVLVRERDTERTWRAILGDSDATLAREIAAAGHLPGLAGPVKGWKAQIARQKRTIAGISKMLGYSDAQRAAIAKANPAAKPPVPTGVQATHTYGGDVANNLGTVLAAALGPFTGAARGGLVMDSGGTLRPGFNPVWNNTGRPESLVPARGGGGVHLHLTVNAPVGSQQQLEDWFVRTANKTAQHGRLRQAVRAASR